MYPRQRHLVLWEVLSKSDAQAHKTKRKLLELVFFNIPHQPILQGALRGISSVKVEYLIGIGSMERKLHDGCFLLEIENGDQVLDVSGAV